MIRRIFLSAMIAGVGCLTAFIIWEVGHSRALARVSVPGLKYDFRTPGGVPLASIFEGLNFRLPQQVIARLIAEAKTPPPQCPKEAKTYWSSLWQEFGSPSVFAQSCGSACQGHYEGVQSVNDSHCPDLSVCNGSGDYFSGCEGWEYSCSPYPGSACGQNSCPNGP